MNKNVPARKLREHPDLDQLRRQAKELLDAYGAGDVEAVAEVNAHYGSPDRATFALHDAQLILARAYGFDSWPKLKAYVEGVSVRRFEDAVRACDLQQVRAMLKIRPELAHPGSGLRYAVLNRSPEMVHLLVEHGADARKGVYPHRDATSALAIARDRGYDEIVAIIKNREPPEDLFQAIASDDDQHAIAILEANPALIQTRHQPRGWTPLHVAAQRLNPRLVAWLVNHAADAMARDSHTQTPLDLAANSASDKTMERFAAVAGLLRQNGAELSAAAAVALGEADWLRERSPIEDAAGLLTIAAKTNRPGMLALLLDFGLDPNERTRLKDMGEDELVFTQGMPLWHCAGSGKYAMAEMLLERGADPNAQVYASGDPVFQAYSQRDWKMVELLERYGGVTCATTAGLYRQTDLARKMLAGDARYRLDGVGGETLAEQLLWGAACGGDPEIVRMALQRVDWPRDDPRWFTVLEQPLRVWTHGSGGADWGRGSYLACFRLLLERCDGNTRGRFGLTILHSVAGSRPHVTAEERVGFATTLLDAGAKLNIRDRLLESTPLGWACRWGRVELVKLLLERGADAVEADAEPWATPRAWAEKMRHADVVAVLREHSLNPLEGPA